MLEFLFKKKAKKQAKILIVEDEPEIRATVRLRFQKNDYEVVTACNGVEGFDKALSERPDIILLDVMMPQMTGIEMLEKLRKTPEGWDVPVIMLTASSDSSDIKRAMASNIEDYIVKPFDLGDVMKKVKKALEGRE